jgi:hypothetical protein
MSSSMRVPGPIPSACTAATAIPASVTPWALAVVALREIMARLACCTHGD